MTCEHCKNSTSTYCSNCLPRHDCEFVDLEEWAKSQRDFYIAIRDGQFMIKERGENGCRIHADTIFDAIKFYKQFKNQL